MSSMLAVRCAAAAALVGFICGCGGSTDPASGVDGSVPAPSDVGAPCVPSDEHRRTFGGFAVDEVVVDPNLAACTDACLVAGFQGRVSCPYGQSEDSPAGCSLPCDEAESVTADVPPQLIDRPPEDAVYCSCPCDGPPSEGPFCTCPDGFECADVTHGLAPSYCVRQGTRVHDFEAASNAPTCNVDRQNCGPFGPDVCTEEGGAAPSDGAPAGEEPRRLFSNLIENKQTPGLDLLLVVDNSIGMGEKQRLLQQALPDLVQRLINPLCIDSETGETAAVGSPSEPCPSGFERQLEPIDDMHLGVITSSLGGFGSSLCEGTEEQNDRAELLGSRPRAFGIAAVEGPGFLRWGAGVDRATFTGAAVDLVGAATERGCGFEPVLESWYRFLVDPAPPQEIQIEPCGSAHCATPVGRNETILDQRAAFLRPDSMVAVMMLSDENDCSIQNTGQLYYAARPDITLPRASPVCDTNPNDPCCYSCGVGPGPECPNPPPGSCEELRLTAAEDQLNLRCFQQKRRFGISFLFPVARYVNALSELQLCTSRADLSANPPEDCPDDNGDGTPDVVPNPLFEDLSGAGKDGRPKAAVTLAGILGVPWQDIATPESLVSSSGPLEYLSGAELGANDAWSIILGMPNTSPPVPPADPLMRESIDPRTGQSPVVGAELQPPTAERLANPINGHEWSNGERDDLQYACIYPLAEPRDCSLGDAEGGCACTNDRAQENDPLCQAPDGTYGTTQYFDKAYPSLRQLEVISEMDENAVAASVCARNTSDPAAPDYGYRPAMGALVDRLASASRTDCFGRTLPTTSSGDRVLCHLVEAIPQGGKGCDGPARSRLEDDGTRDSVFATLRLQARCSRDFGRPCDGSGWSLCDIAPSRRDDDGNEVPDCLETSTPDSGWCYVDPDQGLGSPALVADCPKDSRRIVRTAGDVPTQGASLVLVCDTAL